jgi:UrcA family protein
MRIVSIIEETDMPGHTSNSCPSQLLRRACRTTGLTLLALGAIAAGSGIAAVATQEVNVGVRYSKAELTSADGAARLYRRIQYAARRACGEADGRELKRHFLAQTCYERAVDAAVAKVDEPSLTALHRSRSPRTAAG